MSVINISRNNIVENSFDCEFRCIENITYRDGVETSVSNYYDINTNEIANDEFDDGGREYVATAEEIFGYTVDAWRIYMRRVREGFERGFITSMNDDEIIGSEMFVAMVERDFNRYVANARRYDRCVESMA